MVNIFFNASNSYAHAQVGLIRWRLSSSPVYFWEQIVENDTALEPYPISTNKSVELQNYTHRIFPVHIQPLENPCLRDLGTHRRHINKLTDTDKLIK